MGRTYAHVKVSIWANSGFRRLSPLAQHLYFTLITDPALTYAGIADWRPSRISGKAEAWIPEVIETAACELLDARMVVICERTEEIMVRSFLRHDGVLKNAKLAVSAANAVSAIASNDLRAVAVFEAKRAKKENPEWTAWGNESIREMLAREAVDAHDIDPFGPDLAPNLGRIWEPKEEGLDDA